MKGPYAGKRTAAEGLLYPRYESVQDLVEGKLSASMSPAPASTAERQASKAALFTPAVAAHRPAGVQQPVDKMELSVEERKRLKREKRAQRHGNVAVEADNKPSVSGAALQGEGSAATPPDTACKAGKKEEKKRKRAEQQQLQQEQQEADGVDGGEGSPANAGVESAAGKKTRGNAEEARRIREALGYVAPASGSTAAVEKSEAAKTAAPSQSNKRFAFGFNIQQQKESEADAKVARLMALDATKDGFVARRVWLCGMPHEYSEEDVRAYWEECGPIESMDLLRFKDSGRFNGAAFVTFKTEEGYASALSCNGLELEGRRLKVDKCKTIVPRSQQHSNPEHAQHLAMHNGTSSVAAPLQPPQASSPAPAPAPAATAPAQPSTQQESDEYVAYIGNVAFEATQEELQDLFAPYGCTQIRMHKDKNSGRPKGFAHAHFGNRASLDRAVKGVDGADLHDRKLKVAVAAQKKNKS